MRQTLIYGLLTIWLCGCATFPQLDAMITEDAENSSYPKLLPPVQVKALGLGDRQKEFRQVLGGGDLEAQVQRLNNRGTALSDLIPENDADLVPTARVEDLQHRKQTTEPSDSDLEERIQRLSGRAEALRNQNSTDN